MSRRVVVSTLLAAALVFSLTAWREATPNIGGIDSGLRVPLAPAPGLDAPLTAKIQILAGGWIEHRTVKSRPRGALAVLVGLSALLVVVIAGLHRLSPGRRPTVWRRSSVSLRAPPAILRLS